VAGGLALVEVDRPSVTCAPSPTPLLMSWLAGKGIYLFILFCCFVGLLLLFFVNLRVALSLVLHEKLRIFVCVGACMCYVLA
jgi:hypothetical protein